MLTEEQFSYLAKKYMDMVFRLALHYTKSRSESDDITQEVLIKLYRADKPFESEDHVRYWLIRVTVNECKRAFLSPWKRTEAIDDYTEQIAFKTPEHSELFHAVMALPQKYRVPLFLHYYEGYFCEEISQFLGIPNATVRTRLRRGREQLKTNLDRGVINVAQLHGSEDDAYIASLRVLTDKPIFRAFKIKSEDDLPAIENCAADLVLLDSGAGTGKTFDWSLVRSVQRPYFLAGGLDPDNIADAIAALHPYGVDVSSGIETDGVKDEVKMAAFVAAARREG